MRMTLHRGITMLCFINQQLRCFSCSCHLQKSPWVCCRSSWHSAASSSSQSRFSSPGSSAGCHGGTRKVEAWAWRRDYCPVPEASAVGRSYPLWCRGRTATPLPPSTPLWVSTTPTSLTWWGRRGARLGVWLGGHMRPRSTHTWIWTLTPTTLVRASRSSYILLNNFYFIIIILFSLVSLHLPSYRKTNVSIQWQSEEFWVS